MPDTSALRAALADALPERPVTLSLWDGSEVPTTGTNGPTFSARSPQALAHLLRAPGELGLGRAYVAGVRDARAVRHQYDAPSEFFRLFLGSSMAYSCAIFSRGATTLEQAQEAKHELICQKLGLERGQRVLDVGSGWGAFAIHAARRHGVHVTGVTVSPSQVERAHAETLRHWAQSLDDHVGAAIRLAGAERVRVWRLYLRAARNGFETGFTSVYQVRAS